MQEAMPGTYKELWDIRNILEKSFHDMLDIEFTIQEGTLYMLQCRTGKRTGTAALNMAMDMLHEKLIDEKTVVMRVEPVQLDELLHPIINPEAEKKAEAFLSGKSAFFGVELKRSRRLIGAVGLRDIDRGHCQAEMGFWVGVESWGKGFASEAATAAMRYGFECLKLNRIYAHNMVRNPASGRVLEKIGMKQEGLLRQCVRKWGVFEDVLIWATLRADWSSRRFCGVRWGERTRACAAEAASSPRRREPASLRQSEAKTARR